MNMEAVKLLYGTLQRYAGWLDRGRASVAVRADVASLGTAIDAGGDTSSVLSGLDTSIAGLPPSAVRKMLRATAADIRHALAARHGQGDGVS